MTEQRSSRLAVFLAVLAGALALLAGAWVASSLLAPAKLASEELNATYLDNGRDVVTDFKLVTHEGDPFGHDSFRGRWTLLFFGFTNCPDICPTTMLDLAAVQSELADAGTETPLRTVFVTVDPDRDTQERLAAYVPAFHQDFVGVTGDLEQIDRLARDLGIVHVRHNENGDENYMVDHGSAVLLINPDGRLQAIFQAPHRADSITGDLRRILDHHRPRG